MERMSGADALMLYLDRKNSYNHTIKLSIVDPSEDPQGWSWVRFKEAWATRAQLLPRLRQRYLRVPFGVNHPVWVDDPDFDLDYHLKRVGCPAPGGMVELCELVSQLYAQPLDHTRPLWRVWAVEGLEGGRVCVVLFIHHAITDGLGILRMLNNFWRTRPEAFEHPEPEEWRPAPLPSRGRLLAEGLRDFPAVVASNLPGAIRGLRAGRRIVRSWQREGRELPPTAGDRKYAAPYARRVSPHRSFAARSFQFGRIRAIGKALGVTVNDVFLATLAGAVRRLQLESNGADSLEPMVATVAFALVPLSERTRDGNFSTTGHTLLRVDVADPLQRLQDSKQAADTMKTYFEATRDANLASLLSLLPPLVPKLVDRVNEMRGGGLLPFWNIVASNVPGPREPLRLGQLKLESWFSIGQIAHGTALNVTVWTYVDQFNVAVLCDPEIVPDVWRLVDHFEASIAELEAVAAARAEST